MLAMQRPVGVGGEPFTSEYSSNGTSDMSFGGSGLFLRFWASLLIVFKSFIPFKQLFYFKKRLFDAPK
jgi:hypothetical protein